MANLLNPYATEYYPSFSPPHIITHLPNHISSTYNIIWHYPPPAPSIPFNPHTITPINYPYSCGFPRYHPPSANVFPSFSVGTSTTTQHANTHLPYYLQNVSFGDMGPGGYHQWRQLRNPPPPLLSSSYFSPPVNQTRIVELSSTTPDDETHNHQQPQAITADEEADWVKKLIAEISVSATATTSFTPAHGPGSSSSSKGKQGRSNFNRKPNNSLGSASQKNPYYGSNGKSELTSRMYYKVKSHHQEDDQVEPIQQGSSKTTVMIKNIPNQLTRRRLIEFLDAHCQSENAKLSSTDDKENLSAFDFLYLPIDFCTLVNKGYAFVNFTNPTGVWKLNCFLNKYEWNVLQTKKIAVVTYAMIQGMEALVNRFEDTWFACDSDEFLPVFFDPYRDGSAKEMVRQYSVTKCRGHRKKCYPYCRHYLLRQNSSTMVE